MEDPEVNSPQTVESESVHRVRKKRGLDIKLATNLGQLELRLNVVGINCD
jgi:hypothetical protein